MNPKSIILLSVLISIVLFMVGVNLGKKIEIVDKTHPFVTPKITIQPTTTPIPLAFKTFTSKTCGVSFLYPASFENIGASTAAELVNNTDVVKITCDRKAISDFNKNKTQYIKGTSIIVNKINLTTYLVNDNESFEVINPVNGKNILFETSSNLTPLISKSIEFNQ